VHVNGFTYGILTPGLAYLMSCVGSVLGLQSMSRARAVHGWARNRWIILGATSIGGTGIWVMHFVAMLGFTVSGLDIRYDVPLTLLSLGAAIVVVGIGLNIVVRGNGTLPVFLFGGLITGSGVAAMHYLGMSAMRMSAPTHYDVTVIVISEVIAVAAATAALWFTIHIRGAVATVGAALIMGIAVTGMHYTGMTALHVGVPPVAANFQSSGIATQMPGMFAGPAPAGASAAELLTPLVIGISISTVLILLVVAMAPTERELKEEAAMNAMVTKMRSRDEKRGATNAAEWPAE
jgi:NO-binding membrane sensor protein with MHYT domain